MIKSIVEKILAGGSLSYEEACRLAETGERDLPELLAAANRVREKFAGNKVDLCAIINAKSGNCSEDCKYCAQSAHHNCEVDVYDLLPLEEILQRAKEVEREGVRRFSLVTSGKGINDRDFAKVIEIYKVLRRETSLHLCASLGIIDYDRAMALKEAGVTMYHHNLETAKSYFDKICTTHTYEDRVSTIMAAKRAGLKVCSGGIISMGETMEQRIEMAFALKELDVASVPINILNPIPGTALAGMKVIPPMEILKTIALFRLILPDKLIRFAGGREQALRDLQSLGYFAGINASLVGSYLTTKGRTIVDDKQLIADMGLEI